MQKLCLLCDYTCISLIVTEHRLPLASPKHLSYKKRVQMFDRIDIAIVSQPLLNIHYILFPC